MKCVGEIFGGSLRGGSVLRVGAAEQSRRAAKEPKKKSTGLFLSLPGAIFLFGDIVHIVVF